MKSIEYIVFFALIGFALLMYIVYKLKQSEQTEDTLYGNALSNF